MTIFRHEQTQQVIDVSELKPNVFDVLSTPMERSILNSCGWRKCPTDPDTEECQKSTLKVWTASALTLTPQLKPNRKGLINHDNF